MPETAELDADEARLEAFLLREDVPAEAKKEAVRLYKAESPEPPPPGQTTPTTQPQTTTTTPVSGSQTTTTTLPTSQEEEVAPEPEKTGDAGWTPTIARTAGPIIGAAVGSAVPIIGTAVGGAVGAGVGDWIAQSAEVNAGSRQAYNPLRGSAEVITAGYFSKFQAGKTLMQAAAKGAIGNIGSDTFINLTDGKGLPSTFELAVSGLTGGILSGLGRKSGGISNEEVLQARKAAAKEITGSDEVAERLASFMGPTQAGQQLELPGSRLSGGSILDQAPQQLEFPKQQRMIHPGEEVIYKGQPATLEPIFPRLPGEPPIPQVSRLGKVDIKLADGTEKAVKLSDVRTADKFRVEIADDGSLIPVMGKKGGPERFGGESKPLFGKPGTLGVGAKKRAGLKKFWTDEQLKDQMGFDDLEEGRTFQKIFQEGDSPDQYSLNLGDAKPTGAVKVAQPTISEADEFASMQAKGLGKREMLETPLDRDPTWGDVSETTKGMMEVGRPKDVAKRLEMETNFPLYQDYHEGSQAYRTAQEGC